eukprot:5753402-Amphidinium_carterae.1
MGVPPTGAVDYYATLGSTKRQRNKHRQPIPFRTKDKYKVPRASAYTKRPEKKATICLPMKQLTQKGLSFYLDRRLVEVDTKMTRNTPLNWPFREEAGSA